MLADVRRRGAPSGAGLSPIPDAPLSTCRVARGRVRRGQRQGSKPALLPWNPVLKMEAQTLPEPASPDRWRADGGVQQDHRPRSRPWPPRPAPGGLWRAGDRAAEAPRSCRLTSPSPERAFAALSRRYLMRTSRFKRMFCAGIPFSAPPLPPQENNRVFNLSRS